VLRTRIYSGFSVKIAALDSALQVLQARIRAADPERVLERGYSLVLDGSGRVMKGTTGFREGDDVRVRFADGTLDCVVRSVAGRDDKRN
jgi:exodeoxyribonuclease VII large subunit